MRRTTISRKFIRERKIFVQTMCLVRFVPIHLEFNVPEISIGKKRREISPLFVRRFIWNSVLIQHKNGQARLKFKTIFNWHYEREANHLVTLPCDWYLQVCWVWLPRAINVFSIRTIIQCAATTRKHMPTKIFWIVSIDNGHDLDVSIPFHIFTLSLSLSLSLSFLSCVFSLSFCFDSAWFLFLFVFSTNNRFGVFFSSITSLVAILSGFLHSTRLKNANRMHSRILLQIRLNTS